MSTTLDGKAVAEKISEQVKELVNKAKSSGVTPKLSIIVGTDDKSTLSYVGRLSKKAAETGIEAEIVEVKQASYEGFSEAIMEQTRNDSVHGILLQTPLPEGVSLSDLTNLIPASKDVDGANPTSAGNLLANEEAFGPATAEAVIAMLDYYDIDVSGKNVAVIGRSMVVGKPVANLLVNRDATVTICHSKTQNLPGITKAADVLVVAIGKAEFIGDDYVSEGQIVIDVGTNFDDDGKMVGDVKFTEVSEKIKAISPVPGGVGPITTTLLLKHTCEAALRTL